MFLNNIMGILSAVLLAHSAAASFDLYAYGQTEDVIISSRHIFYAGGMAYAGEGTPPNMSPSTIANVSFSMVDEDTTTATGSLMIESANATQVNTTMDGAMFAINTTLGSFDNVQFISGNDTDLTTTGFRIYGQYVMYRDAEGRLQSNFYLLPSDVANLWELRWYDSNADYSANDTAIPVALRTLG